MDMISDIESTDIKASVAVSRVIWALLNAIFSGDEEDDVLSFQDKELLEDILRFGTMAEVGRRSGRTYYAISTQLASVLDRLDEKVNRIDGEMGKLARLQDEKIAMQAKIANYVNELNEKNIELLETKSELHQLKGSLTHTQHKLLQTEA